MSPWYHEHARANRHKPHKKGKHNVTLQAIVASLGCEETPKSCVCRNKRRVWCANELSAVQHPLTECLLYTHIKFIFSEMDCYHGRNLQSSFFMLSLPQFLLPTKNIIIKINKVYNNNHFHIAMGIALSIKRFWRL